MYRLSHRERQVLWLRAQRNPVGVDLAVTVASQCEGRAEPVVARAVKRDRRGVAFAFPRVLLKLLHQRVVPAKAHPLPCPIPRPPEKLGEQALCKFLIMRQDWRTSLDAFPALSTKCLQGFLSRDRFRVHRPQVIGLEQVRGMQRHAAVVLGVKEGEGQVHPIYRNDGENDLVENLGVRTAAMFTQDFRGGTDAPCGLGGIGQRAFVG